MEKAYVKGTEPRKAVQTFDQLKDQRLRKPLSTDNFVTQDDLMKDVDVRPEIGMPAGMRAIAIRVDAQSGVGGYIQPHSKVDVICTVKKSDWDSYTQTILQNILVLAVDDIYIPDRDKEVKAANTVLLALRPDEVQKIRLASSFGELSLALRCPGDELLVSSRAAYVTDLNRPGIGGVSVSGGDKVAAEGGSRIPGRARNAGNVA